jgi:hypothetical protein
MACFRRVSALLLNTLVDGCGSQDLVGKIQQCDCQDGTWTPSSHVQRPHQRPGSQEQDWKRVYAYCLRMQHGYTAQDEKRLVELILRHSGAVLDKSDVQWEEVCCLWLLFLAFNWLSLQILNSCQEAPRATQLPAQVGVYPPLIVALRCPSLLRRQAWWQSPTGMRLARAQQYYHQERLSSPRHGSPD